MQMFVRSLQQLQFSHSSVFHASVFFAVQVENERNSPAPYKVGVYFSLFPILWGLLLEQFVIRQALGGRAGQAQGQSGSILLEPEGGSAHWAVNGMEQPLPTTSVSPLTTTSWASSL